MMRVVLVTALVASVSSSGVAAVDSNLFTIAAAQVKTTTLAVNASTLASHIDQLDAFATQAASHNANVLVLPELFYQGYTVQGFPFAIPDTDPVLDTVSAIAAKHDVAIVFPFGETGDTPGVVFDSAVLFNRTGHRVLKYRKVNLAAGEDQFLTAGNVIGPVAELDGVRVGVLICFDIFLPEPARLLALQGAQVVLVPTANGYPADYNPLSRVIVPARALENNVAVAYVNHVQDEPGFPPFLKFHGQSVVADTGGNIVALADAVSEEVVVGTANFTDWTNGTAFHRPAADVNGLCE